MGDDTYRDYYFEYKLEYPNYKSQHENMYKNDFNRKYSQGHYIHLVQSERNRSTSESIENEKSSYVKKSTVNKICECTVC